MVAGGSVAIVAPPRCTVTFATTVPEGSVDGFQISVALCRVALAPVTVGLDFPQPLLTSRIKINERMKSFVIGGHPFQLPPAFYSHFPVNRSSMKLYRTHTFMEMRRDFLVRKILKQQIEHIRLSWGKRLAGVVIVSEELTPITFHDSPTILFVPLCGDEYLNRTVNLSY